MAIGHASGKVILAGEHAVVYGVPALAVAIDRGATALVREVDGPSVLRLRFGPSASLHVGSGSKNDPFGRAFAALVASVRARCDVRAVVVDAETDLPAGAGLGSSAALGVAIARGACALRLPAAELEACKHAMEWERVFHGTPSGVDAAVAAFGGTLLFTRNGRANVVQPVAMAAPLVLAIGHSGTPSSTKTMVESVARLRLEHPAKARKTFQAIHAIVRNAKCAIEAGDLAALGKLLNDNQRLLAGLQLSTPEIESMCDAARAAGALGAKLTGAGGGGCVIALTEAREVAEAVVDAWKRVGKAGFVTCPRPRSRPAHGAATALARRRPG
jgi:mevalonate kinase